MTKDVKELMDRLKVGHRNLLYVPNDNVKFRLAVKERNEVGDIAIINLQGGYFIVDPDDPIDVDMFWEYIDRERARAVSIFNKAAKMVRAIGTAHNERLI